MRAIFQCQARITSASQLPRENTSEAVGLIGRQTIGYCLLRVSPATVASVLWAKRMP